MARAIIKIRDKYFIWSTIVDAPIVYGSTKEQLLNYFINEAIEKAKLAFNDQMERVEDIGHGYCGLFKDVSLDEIVSHNNLGENGASLNIDEIYYKYGDSNMIQMSDLKKGMWVAYIANQVNYGGEIEVGRVKSWNDKFVFVVYKCAENWDRYEDYTGVATKIEDLVIYDGD
jgi:hypothetical protein